MAKEVKSTIKAVPGKAPVKGNNDGKLSYEDLAAMASRLNTENKQLRQMMTQAQRTIEQHQMQDYYQRLGWLWTVITVRNTDLIVPLPESFITEKIGEFIEMMTPMDNAEPEKKEE